MKLKVCGLKYKDNIRAIAKLQPEYMGFIFYEDSSRFFNDHIPEIPKTIQKVGVFVNATLDTIKSKIKTHQLQAIQLHGDETPKFCAELKKESVTLIKVFSINNQFDFSSLTAYETVCDYYLFDTKGPLPGGNGYVFDWAILKNYPSTKPYFLSGGIGLNDIKSINNFFKTKASNYCYALDVNSKFEIEPGLKNIKELEQFKYELQH